MTVPTTAPLRAGEQLVVDLAGIRFRDSNGITALLAARNHVTTI